MLTIRFGSDFDIKGIGLVIWSSARRHRYRVGVTWGYLHSARSDRPAFGGAISTLRRWSLPQGVLC